MPAIHGTDCERGLMLVLHTPGGSPTAAQTFVEYLRSKFDDIEAIIPTYAMSAETIIALGYTRLVMSRRSHLGPIDPQVSVPGVPIMTARGIVDLFEQAQKEIIEDLEASQELQDEVLSVYRPMTIVFKRSPLAKVGIPGTSNGENSWLKNMVASLT